MIVKSKALYIRAQSRKHIYYLTRQRIMASILAKNNSQYLREVFRVVESYDLEKLLNDAVTSLIISSRERKEIVDHVHSKTEMWDKFQKLVLERGRLTDFVSFILDYDNRVHRRVQDAAVGLALSVLSLRQTSEEYLPNSDSPEDSPPSSPSKSYSPSQMDPADTDANKVNCHTLHKGCTVALQ